MIIDASYGSPNIKPPLWAIDPGIVAYNASRMGLPMPVGLWVWPGGNWPDLSGQRNDGTIHGATLDAGSLSFDGVTNYVDCGDVQNLGLEYSFVWRMQVNDTTSQQSIIAKDESGDREFGISINIGANRMSFYGFIDVGGTWFRFDWLHGLDTNWHHWAIVSNGTILKMYKDGREVVLYSSDGTYGGLYNASTGLHFGKRAYVGAEDYFNGSIDEVIIFNEPFTPSQVATISADPHGLVRQPSMEELWVYEVAVGGVAPTSIFYGPLVGPLGGPI